MDLRVKKESEDSVETLALWALQVPSASEDLLVTEDSLVLTDCKDRRVPKVIVERLVHRGLKVL